MKLEQIATLAGVSKTTASYVINGKAKTYRISEKTQQKVMAVVNEYNYQPDHAAASLRAGNSRTFGLIIPDIENSSYAKLAKLLEQNSRQIGYQMLIGGSDDDPEVEKKIAEALVNRRIEALFVASAMPDASEYYKKIQDKGTPVIALDRPLDDEYFSCVISEDFNGAHELTNSLLSDSIKTIGFIGAMPDLNISKQRQFGFEAAIKQMQTSSYSVRSLIGYGDHFTAASSKKVIEQWLQQGQLPDAIITTSYTLMEGVLDKLLKDSPTIPTIKLATFGDNRLLDFLPIKVNTLTQQFELIADSALTLALNASVKGHISGVELIPRQLKLR